MNTTSSMPPEEVSSVSTDYVANSRKLGLASLIGECMCNPFIPMGEHRNTPSTPLVELHGVRFIGLGALMDELTPRERVYDTLEQLTTRTDRLVSVGYLVNAGPTSRPRTITETVPLDVWSQSFPNDKSMDRVVKKTIAQIRVSTGVIPSQAGVLVGIDCFSPGQYLDSIQSHRTKNSWLSKEIFQQP